MPSVNTKRRYIKGERTDKVYTPFRNGRPRIKRICQQCDTIYYPKNRTNNKLYCSRGCYAKWQSLNLRGARANGYKAEKASYSAIHHWIKRERGKPTYCESCKTKEGSFEWANISGKYKRILSDWRPMCIPCHRKYDAHHRLATYKGSRWHKVFQERKEYAKAQKQALNN